MSEPLSTTMTPEIRRILCSGGGSNGKCTIPASTLIPFIIHEHFKSKLIDIGIDQVQKAFEASGNDVLKTMAVLNELKSSSHTAERSNVVMIPDLVVAIKMHFEGQFSEETIQDRLLKSSVDIIK